MNFFLALMAIACLTRNAFAQQNNISRRQASQYCITPENYYGSCVTLSYCPQVVNAFQTQPQRVATQYVIALQRSCGTRSVGGDPVVCCTRPSARPVQTARPTQAPVTQASNPFLPTRSPVAQPTSARNTLNPFLNTQRPQTTATPTTTTTTQSPVTSSPLIDNRGTTCRGPDAREGSCIDLDQCNELLETLRNNPQNTAFASYLRASNSKCGGSGTSVCCPSAGKTSADVPRRLPTPEVGCGYSLRPYKKIVGGAVSQIGSWPWAALIGYKDDLSASPFKCGGTLITARHVLTAAHCIRKDLAFVRLGEHDLSTDTETKHVDVPVVRMESHPQYNKRNGRNDIAVLYLQRNVQLTNFVSPICLPITNSLRSKNYENFMPFVVGWGRTMEGGTSATVLQELQIPIKNNKDCQDSYQRQNRLITQDQFDEGVICAGVLMGGKDTCQGDSGGPLMFPEPYDAEPRYYLLGVVSYGIGCARPDVLGVYTSTQYFIDWIAEKVADSR